MFDSSSRLAIQEFQFRSVLHGHCTVSGKCKDYLLGIVLVW